MNENNLIIYINENDKIIYLRKKSHNIKDLKLIK
jgi:hypothetical protein